MSEPRAAERMRLFGASAESRDCVPGVNKVAVRGRSPCGAWKVDPDAHPRERGRAVRRARNAPVVSLGNRRVGAQKLSKPLPTFLLLYIVIDTTCTDVYPASALRMQEPGCPTGRPASRRERAGGAFFATRHASSPPWPACVSFGVQPCGPVLRITTGERARQRGHDAIPAHVTGQQQNKKRVSGWVCPAIRLTHPTPPTDPSTP
jgi:hypothetical protein